MHLTVHGKERTNHCVLKRYVEKKKTIVIGSQPKTIVMGSQPKTIVMGSQPKTIVMGSQPKTIVMGSQPKTREICRPWDVSLVN